MKEKWPKVAIITSTLNQCEILKKCLISLKNNTDYPDYKVYFVDDSGRGKIGNEIKKLFKWVNVSINKKNLGYSISNNYLIKKSIKEYSPEYILHIDDDTEILKKDWLKKTISVAESKKEGGIFGVRLIYNDGSLQWFAERGNICFLKEKGKLFEKNIEMEKTQEVDNIMGAFFLIRRSVINKIGVLDEEFSPAYGEETDFCFRASKAEFKLFYIGGVEVIHYGSSSSKTIVPEKLWFIKKRNFIRLEWLNYGFFKILKYSLIHLTATLFKQEGIPIRRKIKLLREAYLYNFKRIEEIKKKRKERNKWKK